MENSVRPKRSSKKVVDHDFIYEKPLDKHKKSAPLLNSEFYKNVDNVECMGKLVELINTLESRIAELELDRSRLPLDKTINKSSMQEIRQAVGKKADVRELGLPIFPPISQDDQKQQDFNSSSAGKKSGYELKSQLKVQRDVLWPHAHTGPIEHICNVKPDNLSLEAFMFGFFMILNSDLSKKEMQGRLEHAQQLMYHTIMHVWASERRFHYKILWAMEHQNLDWSDKESMLLLSLSAAHESINTVIPKETESDRIHHSNKRVTERNKSILCYFYNNDTNGCKYEKSVDGCKKLHACSSCAEKGFFNNHKAFECKK